MDYFAIQDTVTKKFWCGRDKWSTNIAKAKLYKRWQYANRLCTHLNKRYPYSDNKFSTVEEWTEEQ